MKDYVAIWVAMLSPGSFAAGPHPQPFLFFFFLNFFFSHLCRQYRSGEMQHHPLMNHHHHRDPAAVHVVGGGGMGTQSHRSSRGSDTSSAYSGSDTMHSSVPSSDQVNKRRTTFDGSSSCFLVDYNNSLPF